MFRDLSRPIETGMPTYPGDPAVTLAPDATHESDGYATGELRTGTHAGTHVDAPRHTLPEGETVDAADPGRYVFDAMLVDCRPLDPREPIDPAALPEPTRFDAEDAGEDAPDLLVLRTGWAAHWGTDRYRDHPYLSAGAAARCRELGAGVGLDTFGPDPTPSVPDAGGDEPDGTPAHDALLSDSLPIVENLCELDGLPERFRLYAFPLRLRDGDGSPVRAVAEWRADAPE
ncbi:cyclase family protein [Halorubrum halophilum]|uniref:cyclase family protein n=1 Tax=Halorubrum halophilum TaxID=413816 RepID=UPI00186B0ED7|nr:cyclase family protein [Halorubrum halophilum]